MTGKEKCMLLKQIRKEIAQSNGIVYLSSECDYEGDDCGGTCPKCEAEIRYLDAEINRMVESGARFSFSGLTLDYLDSENIVYIDLTPIKRLVDAVQESGMFPKTEEEPAEDHSNENEIIYSEEELKRMADMLLEEADRMEELEPNKEKSAKAARWEAEIGYSEEELKRMADLLLKEAEQLEETQQEETNLLSNKEKKHRDRNKNLRPMDEEKYIPNRIEISARATGGSLETLTTMNLSELGICKYMSRREQEELENGYKSIQD